MTAKSEPVTRKYLEKCIEASENKTETRLVKIMGELKLHIYVAAVGIATTCFLIGRFIPVFGS